MKISDETKVGVLAAFGITILILGYSFLKGNNPFDESQVYYAVYEQVDGLYTSDPVTLNGYVIGKVSKLSLMGDKKVKVIAELKIDEEVKIPNNSIIEMYSSDLLGEKALRVLIGNSSEHIVPGDTLKGGAQNSLQEEVSMQILPVKKKAEDLMGSLDSVLLIVKAIISGGSIENSLSNIENATNDFSKVARNLDTLVSQERQTIHNLLANLEGFTATLDSNGENITQLIANLETLSDSLSKVHFAELTGNLNSALVSLDTLLTSINNSEGSVGMLVNDKEFYNNLVTITESVDALIADVEENPGRYIHFSVFGGGGGKKKKDKDEED